MTSFNLKRFLFKDMIPKVSSKNICSRLVLFGVMHIKIHYLGNWVNSRFLWNGRFQIWTKWFRLIKKLRFISPKWRKVKLLLSGKILSRSRMRKKNHHLHRWPCIALIQIENSNSKHSKPPINSWYQKRIGYTNYQPSKPKHQEKIIQPQIFNHRK